jgi:hypothetical protein
MRDLRTGTAGTASARMVFQMNHPITACGCDSISTAPLGTSKPCPIEPRRQARGRPFSEVVAGKSPARNARDSRSVLRGRRPGIPFWKGSENVGHLRRDCLRRASGSGLRSR